MKAPAKMFSDQQLLAALLAGGSLRRSAEIAGCSVSTMQRRLADGKFRAEYERLRNESLREATAALSSRMTGAVDVLSDVMSNDDNAAAVRLQAASEVLRQGLKFYATAEIERRISALEAVQEVER